MFVFQQTAVMKELQMVMILKMNQWKWMPTSLKMQMINAYRTEHTNVSETIILLEQHVRQINLRDCKFIIQELNCYFYVTLMRIGGVLSLET